MTTESEQNKNTIDTASASSPAARNLIIAHLRDGHVHDKHLAFKRNLRNLRPVTITSCCMLVHVYARNDTCNVCARGVLGDIHQSTVESCMQILNRAIDNVRHLCRKI